MSTKQQRVKLETDSVARELLGLVNANNAKQGKPSKTLPDLYDVAIKDLKSRMMIEGYEL